MWLLVLELLGKAVMITFSLFGALTGVVFVTRKESSVVLLLWYVLPVLIARRR